ncbi:MAG: hypothetical protein M9909_09795 [Thermomicrobiales bacterium]|nr:hypothetical protein [Thermomicrobiales bacterium]
MSLSLPYRLRQVRAYSVTSRDTAPTLCADAQHRLTEPMAHQFRILPKGDQRHLVAVYQRLLNETDDDDTITAGLIHDVGKACAKCRITLMDRGFHVILSRIAKGPYRAFATRETAPGWCRGLHRLANHAERGALAAEQAGYNDRVIYLIRCHERGGDPSDTQLALLRRIDDEVWRS